MSDFDEAYDRLISWSKSLTLAAEQHREEVRDIYDSREVKLPENCTSAASLVATILNHVNKKVVEVNGAIDDVVQAVAKKQDGTSPARKAHASPRALYEIVNVKLSEEYEGDMYVRAYAWADTEEEAVTLSMVGSRFSFDDMKHLHVAKLFDVNSEPFCTNPWEHGWLGPGARVIHRPVT